VIILRERKRRESELRRGETQMTKRMSTVAIVEYAGPAAGAIGQPTAADGRRP